MHILVDMDGVIADWGANWDRHLETFGKIAAALPRHHQQTTFNLNAGRSDDEQAVIAEIFDTEGFYAELDPIPGAIAALHNMKDAGHAVSIVTSPWPSNPTCASDKMAWVSQHLGTEWTKCLVMTMDKTLVRGDVLIDDKPEVTGEWLPSWEHIIFDQPYNKTVHGKRRISDWSMWEEVL